MTIQRYIDPAYTTTDDIMLAAGVARRTVQLWVESGLLPTPRKVTIAGGMSTRFPAWAIERACFIAKKRAEGFTIEEVRPMIEMLGAK